MPHSVSDLGVQNSNAFKCLKLETFFLSKLEVMYGQVEIFQEESWIFKNMK